MLKILVFSFFVFVFLYSCIMMCKVAYECSKENEAKNIHLERLKEREQKIKEICNEMKQDKRFQMFFENSKTVLIRHKNEIEHVYASLSNGELCISLNIKRNKWDIPHWHDDRIVIKFEDYQFRLSERDDETAIVYWFVQEIPFMVYRSRHQGEEKDYETKDILDAFQCYGEKRDSSGIMYVKGSL